MMDGGRSTNPFDDGEKGEIIETFPMVMVDEKQQQRQQQNGNSLENVPGVSHDYNENGNDTGNDTVNDENGISYSDDDGDNGNNDNDDDDDSFLSLEPESISDLFIQEASSLHNSSLSQNEDMLQGQAPDMDALLETTNQCHTPKRENTKNNPKEGASKKRRAQLSFFDFKEVKANPKIRFDDTCTAQQTVVNCIDEKSSLLSLSAAAASVSLSTTGRTASKPALDFDSARYASQSQNSDFISPLETALIGRVDHLKSSHDGDDTSNGGNDGDNDDDDDDDDDNDDDGDKDKYESYVSWLSSFIYSPTNNERKKIPIENNNTSDNDNSNGNNTNGNDNDYDPTTVVTIENQPADSTKTDVASQKDYIDSSLNADGDDEESSMQIKSPRKNDAEINPLLEADEILMRMDTVSNKLSYVIQSQTKNNKKSKRQKIRLSSTSKKDMLKKSSLDHRILNKIDNNPKDIDPGTPWKRMIILEEFGTASSWIVLLLPYITFVIALILDSNSSLWNYTSHGMETRENCSTLSKNANTTTSEANVPLNPVPDQACWYEYHLKEGEGLLHYVERYVETTESNFQQFMSEGVAITTGKELVGVPALSTYLFADIHFDELSAASVSLVSEGRVQFSSVVMQKEIRTNQGTSSTNNSENEKETWLPVSISKPTQLEMVCNHEEDHLKWDCNSPSVNLLFTLPGTSELTGGIVRIDTMMSYKTNEPVPTSNVTGILSNWTNFQTSSKVYLDHVEDKDQLSHANLSNPHELLLEIAQSSSYYVSHRRKIQTDVLIAVRIGSLVFTFAFLLFWIWSMGFNGFFGVKSGACCCLFLRKCHNVTQSESLLWENPWVLFPERRFLLLMMLSLLLVQNPVMVWLHFHPNLYASARMHMIADSSTGIGIHGILALWLCLLQGLKYHTAEIHRKRAENQRQHNQLAQTINFLRSPRNRAYEPLSDDIVNYYNEYGDFDGKGPKSWTALRMKHDPCGDNWPDFLLSKIFLGVVGVSSVIVSSYFRFPEDYIITQYHNIFAIASLVQLFILALWILLIIRAAVKTGQVLRTEPFLSTRPAQLAFRILMSMIVLGAASFVILFSADLCSLTKKWNSNQDFVQSPNAKDRLIYHNARDWGRMSNSIDILYRVVFHLKERVPYVTTSNIGPGSLLYITVSTITVAFIFLPSTDFILNLDHRREKENGDLRQRENQRRDKRTIITLSKNTHTWRIFPLPIDREKKLSAKHYQIDKKFQLVSKELGPGTIYSDNYVPVFCVETALWLLESSWQTYYSATEFKTDEFCPGLMNLGSVGLKLEADIFDEETDTRAFVATNLTPQVDGDTDSVIVIAFRGTVSTTNLKTDFNWAQQSLPEMFTNTNAEYSLIVSGSSENEYGSLPNVTLVKNNEERKGQRIGPKLLKTVSISPPTVHCGFLHSYSKVRNEIMKEVLSTLQRQLQNAYGRCEDGSSLRLPKIYVTGHSLGGSLGQLLALDLACNVEITNESYPDNIFHRKTESFVAESALTPSWDIEAQANKGTRARSKSLPSTRVFNATDDNSVDFVHTMLSGLKFDNKKIVKRSFRPPIAMYSFGQPRIGNHAFARIYKNHVPHTFRVVCEGDLITSIPFATFLSGISLYKHAGLEVALDEGRTGNILVGPTKVETLFRFSKVRTSLNAHLMENYRKGIESAFTQDELEKFYRHRCSSDHSFRYGFNTSDILPDWVTDVNLNKKDMKNKSFGLPTDWISEDKRVDAFAPDWAR